eukprot:768616-Hanusia_phi.AAC.3
MLTQSGLQFHYSDSDAVLRLSLRRTWSLLVKMAGGTGEDGKGAGAGGGTGAGESSGGASSLSKPAAAAEKKLVPPLALKKEDEGKRIPGSIAARKLEVAGEAKAAGARAKETGKDPPPTRIPTSARSSTSTTSKASSLSSARSRGCSAIVQLHISDLVAPSSR